MKVWMDGRVVQLQRIPAIGIRRFEETPPGVSGIAVARRDRSLG
jgi:hypothetical protein